MRQIILSALLAVSPVLAWGQDPGARANQAAPAQVTVNEITVNQTQAKSPSEITCVGNFGEKFTLTVPASRFLTPEDAGYGRAYDFKTLDSTGCGYDTVAPIPQDNQAFRK